MPLPPHAKRVFKGIIFDVYQWEQEMFDGSTQTFEMLTRPLTVDVLATQGDKILIARQSQPTKPDFYSLFGGRGEENEAPIVTAKRELLEEAGLASDDWELLKAYEPFHKIDWKIYYYVARNCRKVADQQLDAGERIEMQAMTLEEFIQISLSDRFYDKELSLDMCQLLLDKQKMEEFKHKLFGT
jgi:ADP-ribose pyrophosphatase